MLENVPLTMENQREMWITCMSFVEHFRYKRVTCLCRTLLDVVFHRVFLYLFNRFTLTSSHTPFSFNILQLITYSSILIIWVIF
jgi:hypothetical protein